MVREFASPYSHGFVRIATAIPSLRVADPAFNAAATAELGRRCAAEGAAVVVFPELGLSAYSLDDLVQQDVLLEACREELGHVLEANRGLSSLWFVGMPLRVGGRLFNTAVAIHDGAVLGVVPKSYLPNYREFYEKRHYSPGRQLDFDNVELLGRSVPFGADLIFEAQGLEGLKVHAEICEDVWVPVPPSTQAALAGATVLVNLSASNITVGKADYRRLLAQGHSARCLAAYAYAAAGPGESTTDLAWDGHGLIAENGELLAESTRFVGNGQYLLADIDVERLLQERSRMTSFADQAAEWQVQGTRRLRRIGFAYTPPQGVRGLKRPLERFPFVPHDAATLDQRCYEAIHIQSQGLQQRLRSSGLQRIVIGISGGLDSTLALLVAIDAFHALGLPRTHILGYTMPGFATGERTLGQAHRLMSSLGISAEEIDIRPSCEQMLRDLGHPYAQGEPVYDITFENVQAGERSSHLFRLANQHAALVLGTGDLSELALGWCTYGVGDQMSHYNVNASVPKTLVRYLIRWVMGTQGVAADTRQVLGEILDTVISPELVPAAAGDSALQVSEDVVGPYPLQDFTLYYFSRFGLRPSKIAFLAEQAWSDPARGAWPPLEGEQSERPAYDRAQIKHWMAVFLRRFFAHQFKRSAIPNGPKVGGGGSLSPRGDWRMPSDASSAIWLRELQRNVPD